MPGTSASGGRNRKSRAEHALTGTGRKNRGTARAADVPDPPKGRPPIPSGLAGHALAEWTRMVGRLEAAHTLSTVDDAVLYQYCCLFAETEEILTARDGNARLIVKLQAAIERVRKGDLIVEAIAQIVQLKKLESKHATQLRQGHMALRQYLVELGMTPAARSRVLPAADSAPPVNPLDRFTKPRVWPIKAVEPPQAAVPGGAAAQIPERRWRVDPQDV